MQAPGHAGGSVAALLADACADGGALRGVSLCAALLPAGQLAAALAWAALVAAALRAAIGRRRTGVFLLDCACFAPPRECAPALKISQLLCNACQSLKDGRVKGMLLVFACFAPPPACAPALEWSQLPCNAHQLTQGGRSMRTLLG